MKLPKKLEKTAVNSTTQLQKILKFLTAEKISSLDFEGVPLCLTANGVLKRFSYSEPVFTNSQYAALIPDQPQAFLHPSISDALSKIRDDKQNNKPFGRLEFNDLGSRLKISPEIPSVDWLKLMWKFIKEFSCKSEIRTDLIPLTQVKLIPLSDGSIVTPDQASTVLSTAESSFKMNQVIEKMNILRLDASKIASPDISVKEIHALATPLMLNAALPSAFIKSIDNYKIDQSKLKSDDCEAVLQYLSLDTSCVHESMKTLHTVKSLQIYEDIDGHYKCLTGTNGVVLDNCIPTHGTSEWMEKSNCVLLKEKSAYSQLYNALGLVKKNAVDVYLDDIFPNFSSFSDDLRLSHLTSIRVSIIPLLDAYADQQTKDKFWTRLRHLKFINYKTEGLLEACRFRDPAVEVLALLPDLRPLPLSFTEDNWLEFLRKAGLKTAVNDEELLTCAHTVSKLTIAEFSEEKSKLIVETITTGEFKQETINQLCDIRFIPPDIPPVDETLSQTCPPLVSSDEYISLRGSIIYEHDKQRHIYRHSVLCWTTRFVLPRWTSELPKNIIEMSGIQEQPSIQDVCNHIKNLSEKLPQKPNSTTFKSFRKVVSYCLDYLQNPCCCFKKKCLDCAGLRSLRNVQFVCVKTRHTRVKPSQVVLNLPSDIDSDVLYPYIFSRPTDLVRYDDVLRSIGALPGPNPDMYADILHSLWLDFGGVEALQTNDKQTASLAVYGLFTTLQQPGQRLTSRLLCLPSDKAVMTLSTELVIADNETLAKTVKDHGYNFMFSLSSCNVTKSAKELIFYLPESVRPKLLSQLITEQIRVDCYCEEDLDCSFYQFYYERIHSSKFREALWLLARIAEERRESFSHELGRLKLIEIMCIYNMYAYMSQSGRTMENSQVERDVYSTNSLANAKLFIKHQTSAPGPIGLVTEIACALKSIICYNEDFYIDIACIIDLLKCDDDKQITEYLIDKGLSCKHDDMTRPVPGTLVPPQLKELFIYDPDLIYYSKEYVAYVNKHKEEMLYARVLKESDSTDGQDVKPMFRFYDIDIGQGYPVTAEATDIYKESRRLQVDQQRQLVISDEKTTPKNQHKQTTIIEEAKRTVTRLLEEIYSDFTLWKHREKIKKRLLLKWHPDKAGNSPLTLEVFKHLRSEIDRVEYKYKLDDNSDEEGEQEVYEWEEVDVVDVPTETKNKQENGYKELKGDMELSSRWFDQAQTDLSTASRLHEMKVKADEKYGYEWVCNICCEVMRKSLVAAIAARSPLTTDLESTRFTNKLYDHLKKLRNSPDIVLQLNSLNQRKIDEMTTRQPGLHTKLLNPHQVFTRQISEQVLQATNSLYDSCRKTVPQNTTEELVDQ